MITKTTTAAAAAAAAAVPTTAATVPTVNFIQINQHNDITHQIRQ